MKEQIEIITLLNELFKLMVTQNASDLYIKVGSPPVLRIEGNLYPVKFQNININLINSFLNIILNENQKIQFEHKPELNLMYSVSGVGRFRINVYKQRGTVGFVIRRVKDEIPSIEELNLPPVLKKIALLPRGLVVVTGPTGSGKSTTLASMIEYANTHRTGHIVTIEDPIEYLHKDKKCIISQREVGSDTLTYSDALKNVVRQAPDIILIGEMRDRESAEAAVFLAETGHLVLTTLHANNAPQTVERILQFFPHNVYSEVLLQVSLNLKAVIAQRLITKADMSGRIVAVEVLINNARMADLLRRGEIAKIKDELDFFESEGMQSMDKALFDLHMQGLITLQDALTYADNPGDLKLKIKTAGTDARIHGPDTL